MNRYSYHRLRILSIFQELPNLSEAREIDGKNSLPPAMYEFRLYSGKVLKLYGGDSFELDGKMCEGSYTGDDFCDVSARDESESQLSLWSTQCVDFSELSRTEWTAITSFSSFSSRSFCLRARVPGTFVSCAWKPHPFRPFTRTSKHFFVASPRRFKRASARTWRS